MKREKKFITLLTIFCTVLSALSITACNGSDELISNSSNNQLQSTTDGSSNSGNISTPDSSEGSNPEIERNESEGLAFTLSQDATYYILTGKGSCKDTDIVIPTEYKNLPVLSIGSEAFGYYDKVKSIVIPESVKTICDDAFSRCSSLKNVSIPDSITTLGSDAFWLCSGLEYNVYGNASYIGNKNNPYLILIDAPLNITSCKINKQTKFIHSGAFDFSNISDLTFEENSNLISVGASAFAGCKLLTNVALPNSLHTIGARAFENCTGLVNLNTGGASYIEELAFEGCTALENLFISDKIETVAENVFSNCGKLKYNEYDCAYYLGNASNPYVLLIKAKTKEILSCKIHNQTKLVFHFAFEECREMTNIILGDSLIGIGDYSFLRCTNLMSIVIPNKVINIGKSAFAECKKAARLVLGDSVKRIEESAFRSCNQIEYIIIPSTVEYIGEEAFFANYVLKNVYYKGTEDEWGKIVIGEDNNWLNEAEKSYNYN